MHLPTNITTHQRTKHYGNIMRKVEEYLWKRVMRNEDGYGCEEKDRNSEAEVDGLCKLWTGGRRDCRGRKKGLSGEEEGTVGGGRRDCRGRKKGLSGEEEGTVGGGRRDCRGRKKGLSGEEEGTVGGGDAKLGCVEETGETSIPNRSGKKML